MSGFVYIMASGPYGTLYVGVTNDLLRRAYEHREDRGGSAFCRKYGVHRLVYYEQFHDIRDAIYREKRLKKWPRRWKINLVETGNSHWDDLYPTLIPGPVPPSDRHPPVARQGDPGDPS